MNGNYYIHICNLFNRPTPYGISMYKEFDY